MEERNLQAIDGATLMGLHLEPTRFCVDTLLPQGVCFLGGASKIGKSWMVLDWCVRIAKGEPVWGLPTQKGTTLYLCLEDTLRRVQDRLNRITEEVPGNAYFSAQAETMAGGLLEEIRRFVGQHPDTVLVVVDTFAVVRALGGDQTYGSDYQEVRQLKALADELKITLLMVHHVRKLGDSDPLNRLSGTTGIVGAADTVLILERSRRSADCATFYATGRDTEYREMELRFHRETCSWELLSDIVKAADGGELSLAIPIGNLLGSSLLLGRGFDIPVDITMLSSSRVDFKNDLISAGINQTKHQMKLDVVIDIDVIMPWRTVSTQVVSEILIAETVIVGKVPQTYLDMET